jgi:hypothetical protein
MGSVQGYSISGGNGQERAYRRRKATVTIPSAARIAREMDEQARELVICNIGDLPTNGDPISSF